MNSERPHKALLLLKVKTLGTPAEDGGGGGNAQIRDPPGDLGCSFMVSREGRKVQDDLDAFAVVVGLPES